MPRAKGGPKTRRRHKRQMKLASGFVGGRKLYRQARVDPRKGPDLRLSRSQGQEARLSHALDRAYQRTRARKRNLVQRADERAQEGGRRGRSQDAREARAGARRIVYRAGAHRYQRARLKSSIEPRVSKAPRTRRPCG